MSLQTCGSDEPSSCSNELRSSSECVSEPQTTSTSNKEPSKCSKCQQMLHSQSVLYCDKLGVCVSVVCVCMQHVNQQTVVREILKMRPTSLAVSQINILHLPVHVILLVCFFVYQCLSSSRRTTTRKKTQTAAPVEVLARHRNGR